ncbi:hypothetical protein, partial [Okeania sp. SIO2F5]|uniref:hypothetical protein n=1 Tax=Okeania sp. SIO2F5 TaxID=2607794 RepID=UPI00257A1077
KIKYQVLLERIEQYFNNLMFANQNSIITSIAHKQTFITNCWNKEKHIDKVLQLNSNFKYEHDFERLLYQYIQFIKTEKTEVALTNWIQS